MCLLLCKEVAKSTKYTFTTAPELEIQQYAQGERGREAERTAIWKLKPFPIFQKEKLRQGGRGREGKRRGAREREEEEVHLEVSHSTKINLHPL